MRRSNHRHRPVGLLVALALLAVMLVGPQIGSFLIYREPLTPADAIVVLAGNAPDRLRQGKRLLHEGYAPLLVISNEHVRTHGMNATWLDVYRAGMSAPDVDPSQIVPIDNPLPVNTADEARRAAQILRERGLHSALLVTDPFHSRRSAIMFNRALQAQGITVVSAPPEDDPLDLAHWWTSPRSARTVIEEYVKLFAYLVTGGS